MKNVMIAVLATVAVAPAMSSMAQYKPTGEDGITASPRVRQQLNERASAKSAPATYAVAATAVPLAADGIAASPKLRAQMDERKASTAAVADVAVTTTRNENDGIAASPKVRQQMRDRGTSTQVEIAPVK